MSYSNADSRLALALDAHKTDHNQFPDATVDYSSRFTHIEDHLINNVHPQVNQGAAVGDGLWLTDHGPEHIRTVIRRADALAFKGDTCVLSPYECYLLLCAIHFHDTGNVFGRDGHENRITETIAKMPESVIGDDAAEHRMIRDIAMAHGGYVADDGTNKDTIGNMNYPRDVAPASPRPHLLAAILRFADELADDRTRTNRFLHENNLIAGSEAYHLYCDRLRTVQIRADKTISLCFELDTRNVLKKCCRGTDMVYLTDVIYERLLKLHLEHQYCQKHMQPLIYVPHIDVNIKVCTNRYMDILWEEDYQLAPTGYPMWPVRLEDTCPDIALRDGKSLRRLVRELQKAES